MFNIYSFEKKIKEDEKVKEEGEKTKRIMSTHRKLRDVMAENYQKRVTLFIREMVDSPVMHNDEYTIRTSLNSSIQGKKLNSFEFGSLAGENKSIISNDYTSKLSRRTHSSRYKSHKGSKSTSTTFIQPTPDFRFASYRTEKERIDTNIKINQQFCDSVPNPDKFAFHKSLRAR